MHILSFGLFSGNGPPCFTAIAMSLPMREKALAIRSKRANILCFRFSNILPMVLNSTVQKYGRFTIIEKRRKILNFSYTRETRNAIPILRWSFFAQKHHFLSILPLFWVLHLRN